MPTSHREVMLPLSPSEFTTLVKQYQAGLFGFLCGLVSNAEQARDLTQDVFQDAWRVARRSQSPFLPDTSQEVMRRWLFQAAYHRAISALRRHRRIRWESLEERTEQEPEIFSTTITFEDDFAEQEALRGALNQLSSQDVVCLLLRIVQGFSAIETAEIVGASPTSIDQRLARAKKRLRRVYLAQETPPASPFAQKERRL